MEENGSEKEGGWEKFQVTEARGTLMTAESMCSGTRAES